MPFTNLSDDPEQDYFSDGVTEDIICTLSRFRWFSVISRNSSFVFKGRRVDAKEVARELDVRYVLEGSIRKAGRRVRISAQLIDAGTAHQLWADRYDVELGDILLAHLLSRDGRAALDNALKALKVRPTWPPTFETLACCHVLLGDTASARTCMDQLDRFGVHTVDCFGPLRRLNPEWASALASLLRSARM